MGTVRYCFCDQRLAANERRELLYLPAQRVWYFADGERRSMTAKARWFALERSAFDDHSGEPVTYECCPFCGADLPGVVSHYPLMQADGEGAE